jgi:hypothetical protein
MQSPAALQADGVLLFEALSLPIKLAPTYCLNMRQERRHGRRNRSVTDTANKSDAGL